MLLYEAAKLTSYLKTSGGDGIFFSEKNADVPAINVYKMPNATYKVIISRSRVYTKVRSELLANDRKNFMILKDLKSSSEFDSSLLRNLAGQLRMGYPYDSISLDILHKYPNIFTEKTIHEIKSLHQLLCVDYNMSESHFIQYFGEYNDSNEDITLFKDCRIFFPTSMQESRKNLYHRVIEDCKNIFVKYGIGKAVSGNIKFSQIAGKTAGLYYLTEKEIRIDPQTKDYHQLLYVLIHEFAHKYMYEFINDKIFDLKKDYGEQRYRTTKSTTVMSQNRVELNDEFEYVGKKKVYNGNWKVIKNHNGDEITIERNINGIKTTLNSSITAFISHKFKPKSTSIQITTLDYSHQLAHIPTVKTDSWFPTKYSEANYSEWFAEMLTMYMLNALTKDSEVEKYIKSFI